MCAYLLTLNMASNFISDLSSFSNGAKSLFNLDSTKNPYQNKSYQKLEKEKHYCNKSNHIYMIYHLFLWYLNILHVDLKWEKRRRMMLWLTDSSHRTSSTLLIVLAEILDSSVLFGSFLSDGMSSSSSSSFSPWLPVIADTL